MKKSRVHITDHALVRYLERVLLVDVEGLRRRIGQSIDHEVKYGPNAIRKNGISYQMKGRTVTTIVISERRKRRNARKLRLKGVLR